VDQHGPEIIEVHLVEAELGGVGDGLGRGSIARMDEPKRSLTSSRSKPRASIFRASPVGFTSRDITRRLRLVVTMIST
jgi:hypothetical protein